MPSKRVNIVGGGITGLVAAYRLEQTTDAEIVLWEVTPRLGGKIRTDMHDGFVVERGPDCFFSAKRTVQSLVGELGLEAELIEPRCREFAMLVGGRLHRVPAGLATLNAVRPEAVAEAEFLSVDAKERVLHPRATTEAGDLSIRDFFSVRYGEEFSRLIAEPLLAGTHGGDPACLSMRALYPACLAAPSVSPAPAKRPSFLSFRNGMESLVKGVAGALKRTKIHLGQPMPDWEAGEVNLLAVPAPAAAELLKSHLPRAAEILRQIPHRSSGIVTLAFSKGEIDLPPNLTGFLVPQGEHSSLTGATFSSQKWQGRAPESFVLLRVFLNLEKHELETKSDDELISIASEGIGSLMPISGAPAYTKVDRWIDALPQYEIGHLDRLEALSRSLPEGVILAGTSLGGVGIPDCVRQGEEAAARVREIL